MDFCARGILQKFAEDLKTAEAEMKAAKQQAIPTDEICDKCGAGMVIKFGRFGQFLACTNYPECRTTREIAKPASANGDAATTADASVAAGSTNGEAEEPETCDLCGNPMALKRGRFGQFWAARLP
jgi:DNA topoisomerase-1